MERLLTLEGMNEDVLYRLIQLSLSSNLPIHFLSSDDSNDGNNDASSHSPPFGIVTSNGIHLYLLPAARLVVSLH